MNNSQFNDHLNIICNKKNKSYKTNFKHIIDQFITNIFNKISSNINNNIDAEISSLTYWKIYTKLIPISRTTHMVNDNIKESLND